MSHEFNWFQVLFGTAVLIVLYLVCFVVFLFGVLWIVSLFL